MKEKWYWIELIGFDADAQDFNVKSFLEKIEYDIKGINILFSSIDFVNCHKGMQEEYLLTEGDCSYGGHEYNEERRLQLWTNYRLRDLISELHKQRRRTRNRKLFLSLSLLYNRRKKSRRQAVL